MIAAVDDGAFNGPYRGLEPFDEEAAAFFFGRDREARLITASLYASSLTLLYGASGVGKSSVLRAGALPRMREDEHVLPVFFPRLGRTTSGTTAVERGWQSDPVSGIKEAMLLALLDSTADETKRRQYRDELLPGDAASLGDFAEMCADACERRLMVILDQFEEYSLYHPDEDLFARQFPAALKSTKVSFLVSLREDALARLDRFKHTIPTLWDSYRRIDYLTPDSAKEAIRRPLEEYGRRTSTEVAIEDALVHTILCEVQTQAVQFEEQGTGALGDGASTGRIETPYLQVVMTRLWERERAEGSYVLRLSTLQAEGGARQIVRTHLDRVMAQFLPEERDVAARVFHRLVTPSGSKIAFTVGDLAQYEAVEISALAPILQKLEEGSRRILRKVAVRGDVGEEPRYEIFHDRLGEAILTWRSKHLAEQERGAQRRHDVEQQRLAQESRAMLRSKIDAAMHSLDADARRIWVATMFYLVRTNGARQAQSVRDLAELAGQRADQIEWVILTLEKHGIVREAYHGEGHGPEARYEVVHDAVASALLEWHSQYVLEQGKAARRERGAPTPDVARSDELAGAVRPFPYGLVRDLLLRGQVVPLLGAGVGLSARSQENESARERLPFLPSGRELKEFLARTCDFPPAEFESSDLAEIASYLVQRSGGDHLDELLEKMDDRALAPSRTHLFLAEVARSVPMLILTTNYDALMEKALARLEVPHDVVAYLPDADGKDEQLLWIPFGATEPQFVKPKDVPLSSPERPLVFRMHGSAVVGGRRVGRYVLTEEANIDWILRLRSHDSWLRLPHFAMGGLASKSLLSLGHSARDWSQRTLLRVVSQDVLRSRKRSWAVALRPSPLSVMTFQRYDVEVHNEELNHWAARMDESWG